MFWRDFVAGLRFDDPEQPKPNAGKQGYVTSSMPVPGGNAWLVSYRSELHHEVGVYLSYARESVGAIINDELLMESDEILLELGGTAQIFTDRNGRTLFSDAFRTGPWSIEEERQRAFVWLRERTNNFVNCFRPRIKVIVAGLKDV
jgi:hypothetical protein